MNDLLFTLVQVVLIAAVPVCAAAFIIGVRATVNHLSVQVKNETAERYLEDAADAVCTAVTHISQTYVDELKKDGAFTKEKHEEALNKAVEQAEKLLTAEARDFLEKAYGDLRSYLVSKIEAEVRNQKNEEPVAIGIAEASVVQQPSSEADQTA